MGKQIIEIGKQVLAFTRDMQQWKADIKEIHQHNAGGAVLLEA
ncbi:MAG TPA: hypothetical protein VFB38_05105 [Chthonomonadaceae bacterium]|nr:hypothetical protein [Chthonomonadaceae bacterium]